MQHERLVAAASKYQKNIWEQRHLQEHVPVGDQIVSPTSPTWKTQNSGLHSDKLKTSRNVGLSRNEPLQWNLERINTNRGAETAGYVEQENRVNFALIFCTSASKRTKNKQTKNKKVQEKLQRNSSGVKAYPRPRHSIRRDAWVTNIVLVDRNKAWRGGKKL